jgi:hypothetical protein
MKLGNIKLFFNETFKKLLVLCAAILTPDTVFSQLLWTKKFIEQLIPFLLLSNCCSHQQLLPPLTGDVLIREQQPISTNLNCETMAASPMLHKCYSRTNPPDATSTAAQWCGGGMLHDIAHIYRKQLANARVRLTSSKTDQLTLPPDDQPPGYPES